MNGLPPLRIDGTPYKAPAVQQYHAQLVRRAVAHGRDLLILLPTLKAEYLDFYALSALFEEMSSTILAITPNSGIRNRYESLENANASDMKFSTSHWPLATVKADGSLAYKTSFYTGKTGHPYFIYCGHSTRLPRGDAADRVDVVFYDEAIKFKEARWNRFCDWTRDHDLQSTIYFCRNPDGEIASQVKDNVDTVWAWPPRAIEEALEAPPAEIPTADTDSVVPEKTPRKQEFQANRAQGINYDLQTITAGPVVEAFNSVWEKYTELESVVDDIGTGDLTPLRRAASRTISSYSKLLSMIDLSAEYRGGHHQSKPLSVKITQLQQSCDQLSGKSAAASGPLNQCITALESLDSTIREANLECWKRGAVIQAIKTVLDRDESLLVVAPYMPEQEALRADLQLNWQELWAQAKQNVSIQTAQTITEVDAKDYILLYGPPRYKHRWLLRAPQAPQIIILAYPHELGLLHSQKARLNEAIRELTPFSVDDTGTIELESEGGPLLDENDLQDLIPECDNSELRGRGLFEQVTVEVPDREKLDETDGTQDSGSFETYTLVDVSSGEGLDSIVEDSVSDFHESQQTGKTGQSESNQPATGSDTTRQRHSTTMAKGLVALVTEDDYVYANYPDEDVEVVDAEAGITIEKPAAEVESGEMVVVIENRQAVRNIVENHLINSGHFKLVADARVWYKQLSRKVEKTGDDLADFKRKVENEGLNKCESTYEDWYEGKINLPKAKESLRAMAKAYGMDDVLNKFETVWRANYKIRSIKNDLIDLLKARAHEALVKTSTDEDVLIDEELDVRLSDFDITDDQGNRLVSSHTIETVFHDQELPESYIDSWQDLSSVSTDLN